MAGKMATDAASMVGDAVLNGVFQGWAQALSKFWGFDNELERLKKCLLGVQPLLNDAETRQFTEESVRSWVARLRGLTYDMEDILGEVNYELLRSQQENKDKSDGVQHQIASKITEVLEKWKEIVEDGTALKLRAGVGGRTLGDFRNKRETSFIVDKNRVFGRESDKEEIISFLKRDESSGRRNLSVIGIVGMGGLGKTTLARLAYNDIDQFDMKVWVHVSHDFDCVRVTKSIIEDITKKEPKLGSLNAMQYRLQELVKEKKLLLVLDDAWTENPEDWETLLVPLFTSVQKGSKIIATTRSEAVCKSMGSRDCIYKLKGLSDDDCWTIIKDKVLGYSGNAEDHANLKKLQVKVVEKCKGLPLAANVVGGLLRVEDVDKWERLLEIEICESSKTKDYVLPVLMLSYLYLDPHLKRCFTYTARHYYFNKKEITHLWMAEGFIEVNKSEEMEDIANDYFDNLVVRHFFQLCNDEPDAYIRYEMHDLIRDLAQVIMKNISIRMPEEIGIKMFTEETRHVSMGFGAESLIFDKLVKAKSLRTLSMPYPSIKEVLEQINECFKCLRVLDLYGCSILEVPESIGNLKHLRYLNLCGIHIRSLPYSICTLYNLQTLNLKDCSNLSELPGGIGSLINLRYLLLERTRLQLLPDSVCKLEKLRKINLSYSFEFVVLPTSIGNLSNLRSLNLSKTRIEMLPASLCKLKKLQKINLSCCKGLRVLPTDICELNNLRKLNIAETSVEKLPDFICKLYNLQSIRLFSCNKLTELPKEMSNLINLQSFDIQEELINVSLLPSIERFTNIRRLNNYCITNERGIGRLNLLINLREIRITNLENVKSVEEARVANLKNKHQLVKLEMEWSGPYSFNLRDGNVETEILEVLKPPHVNLRHLTVKNNDGFKFPSWLGDPSFSKLVEIELIGCRKCKLLTSLGQLRSLKKLVIVKMQELKYVGREFFGNGAFPSLLELQVKHLPNLEGWSEAKESDFPRLIELEVRNCPKLRELPITPLTLETLRVYGYEETQECENLSEQDLEVGYCNEITMLKSLSNLTSLSSLTICGFRRVKLLPNGFLQSLKNIKKLEIENCDELLNLPEGPSTTLSKLCIINCPNMTSFGKGFQNITCLESLSIIGCRRLESSPKELTVVSCLWDSNVTGCSNTILTSVLPHLSTLVRLLIKEIDGLQYLPRDLLLNLTCLKYLEIEDCVLLTSLLAELPSSLESLRIIRCTELTSLPNQLPSSLKDLRISCCIELASLPNELPSSLEEFSLSCCDKVKSLPKGLCNLTFLICLGIYRCPLVESFPDNGLPTGLFTLSICECPILIQRCRDRGSKEWSMIKCIENVHLI